MYGQRIGVGCVSQAINISYRRSIRFISDNDRIGRYEEDFRPCGRQTRWCLLHPNRIEPIVRVITKSLATYATISECNIAVVAVGYIVEEDTLGQHPFINIILKRSYRLKCACIGGIGHITHLESTSICI